MAQQSLLSLITFTSAVGASGLSLSFRHAEQSPCACLNWKSTYKDRNVSCGVGNELLFLTGDNHPSEKTVDKTKTAPVTSLISVPRGSWGQVFCTEFYERLNFSDCTNINIGNDEGTWCYVDPECNILNGGAKLHQYNISWKQCSTDDATLRDFTPDKLVKLAKKEDVSFGIMHKFAYPGTRGNNVGIKGGTKVQLVQTFEFENGTWPSRLHKFENTSQPYFFDTHDDGHVPHVILYKGKAYRVDNAPNKNNKHPGSWMELRCMLGCDDPWAISNNELEMHVRTPSTQDIPMFH